MAIRVRVSGIWHTVKEVYVKQAGVWHIVPVVRTRHAGAWKIIHESEVIVYVTTEKLNLDIKSLFSAADWTHPLRKKRVIINAGVIIGSTTATAALLTGAGRSGVLTIVNNGEIQGRRGPANGGDGGTAIQIQQTGVTIENNGAIRGGGGGGGRGGNGGSGGGGTVSSTLREPASGYYNNSNYSWTDHYNPAKGGDEYVGTQIRWAGANIQFFQGTHITTRVIGAYTYYRSGDGVARTWGTSGDTNGGAGGAGGAGGIGRGFGGVNTAGAAGADGAAGGTNAGTGGKGGKGGDGGTWATDGANGATGNKGADGNRTNGLAGTGGSPGGKAGAAIVGLARTLVNNGTINGDT